MHKFRIAVSVTTVIWVVLFIAGSVAAQGEGPTDDEVNAIAKELFCPVCENIPLDVCPTQACQDWRDEIRLRLAAGWTPDQIKQYFVDQHGMQVLAVPQARGFNWLLYVLPPVVFIIGGYILARAVQDWRRKPTAEGATASPANDDPYVEKLEEELRKRA